MEYPVKLISIEGMGFFSGGHILAFYPNGTYTEAKTHELSGDGLMRLSLNDDMLKPTGKVRTLQVSDNRTLTVGDGRVLALSREFEKIIMFCASRGYKAKVMDNFIPGETTEIKMQPLMDGGSVIFPNNIGYIPDFSERLNPILDRQNRTYLHADNVSMNGDPAYAAPFTVGQPFTLEDSQGNAIRLTVKGMNSKSSILEYQKLPPGSPRPAPSPRSAFASSPESVASDDWEPLSIDRGNPVHEEAIENAVKALEDVIENLRGINDHPEANAEMLKVFENDKTKLKTANSISWDGVKKIFEALKKAEQLFSYSERVIRIIELATQIFIRMIEILSGLPFPF